MKDVHKIKMRFCKRGSKSRPQTLVQYLQIVVTAMITVRIVGVCREFDILMGSADCTRWFKYDRDKL